MNHNVSIDLFNSVHEGAKIIIQI